MLFCLLFDIGSFAFFVQIQIPLFFAKSILSPPSQSGLKAHELGYREQMNFHDFLDRLLPKNRQGQNDICTKYNRAYNHSSFRYDSSQYLSISVDQIINIHLQYF